MKLSFVAEDSDNGRNVVMELHVPIGVTHTEITEHYFNFLRAIGYVIDYGHESDFIDSI